MKFHLVGYLHGYTKMMHGHTNTKFITEEFNQYFIYTATCFGYNL